MTDTVDDLFTPEQLADRYGVRRPTVMEKVRLKEWPAIKVGRKVRFDAAMVRRIDRIQTVDADDSQETAERQHAAQWGRPART